MTTKTETINFNNNTITANQKSNRPRTAQVRTLVRSSGCVGPQLLANCQAPSLPPNDRSDTVGKGVKSLR